MKKRIAIFASGNGSNAENIIKHFKKGLLAEVSIVFSNNKTAKVIDKAINLDVKTRIFNREELEQNDTVLNLLLENKIDLIVLAGFLWKFPEHILRHFPDKVVNIHPALLPKYGGKGMYGMHIHRAVVENQESETGITIHYVNENYDEGRILFQAKMKVLPEDSPEDVAAKIHRLEQKHFPQVIEKVITDNL